MSFVLANAGRFFAAMRSSKMLGPDLTPGEVDGLSAILAVCSGWPLNWTAYGLATAYHETAHTLQPIKEMGGAVYFARMYDPQGNRPAVAQALGNTIPGDGARFCGRGYVQLTGRALYVRADGALKLGGELVVNPDLALTPSIAAQIMRRGMEEGWFTGRRLAQMLPDSPSMRAAFMEARSIINGEDRAGLIADYALNFQAALADAGWGLPPP